jgi:hypothetical protein
LTPYYPKVIYPKVTSLRLLGLVGPAQSPSGTAADLRHRRSQRCPSLPLPYERRSSLVSVRHSGSIAEELAKDHDVATYDVRGAGDSGIPARTHDYRRHCATRGPVTTRTTRPTPRRRSPTSPFRPLRSRSLARDP